MFGGLLLAALEVVAVYYPHWHQYPKGTEWFGERWSEGEWTFVKSGKARFPGHKLPMKPLPGYLNGKDPADVATEIDLAWGSGIDVFLYDYYWYGGKITQQEAIEEGFLKAPNRSKMKFALMWCYHERRDAFRIPLKGEDRFLMKLDHTPEEFLGLIDYSIAHYFGTPEYWRKDGKLFFSIYNARDFIKFLGKDAAKKALADARAKIRAAGLGEVNFNAQNVRADFVAEAKEVGFDSLTDYGFNGYNVKDMKKRYDAGERCFAYSELDGLLQARWASYASKDLPYYPVVPTGWDSTQRCRNEEPFPWAGFNYPYGPTITNVTTTLFEKFLRDAKAVAERNPKSGVVYLNAWNEHTEGCYLLPTVRECDQMLRCVGRVFGRRPADKITSCAMKHWWDPKAPNGKAFSVEAPTYENLKYGEHMRQSLDVWLAKPADGKPTPALVCIHGGTWMDGDRLGEVRSNLAKCRQAGVTLVTISYRMVPDGRALGVKPPVKVCLDDAVAAIKFVQAHAKDWNVDPTRIALTGGSAGACSSLYASFQGDNALGVKAILVHSPQTTLDPKEMREWIPNARYGGHAFGYGTFNEWLARRADCLKWINRFSPAELLRQCTASRAPVVFYTCPAVPPKGELPKDPTHAGMFCVKFKEICDAKGVTCRQGGLDQLLEALKR